MTQSIKQHEVLRWASLFLKEHNCEVVIAEILLQYHLQVSRSQFFMDMQKPIASQTIARFKQDIEQHVLTGVPVQHLTGEADFYGRVFYVNENTLIPRPETEELIQCVLDILQTDTSLVAPKIVDVGTGSGVIGITLKLECPQAHIYATDISEHALKVAKTNALQLQADVNFSQGNFLQPIISQHLQPNIIISNPPYISKSEKSTLSRTVKNFDPELALFAEENGLAAYKQIIEQSKSTLAPNGRLVFEIGYEQGQAVTELIQKMYKQSHIQVLQDINGKDRIVVAHILRGN